MKSNRVLPPPPKLSPHAAKLLSWHGPVAHEPPPAEAFAGLIPRTTPAGTAPRAYQGGWVAANLAHPKLQKDGHTR